MAATRVLRDEIKMSVTPVVIGKQLVRVSLPFPKYALLEGQTLLVSDGQHEQVAALRQLTCHPVVDGEPKSVRRGIVTFPHTFPNEGAVQFTLQPTQLASESVPSLPVDIKFALKSAQIVDDETVTISYHDGLNLKVRLLAPPRTSSATPQVEVVESNSNFLWQRVHQPDSQWTRIIEVRADVLGGVVVIAHLQRNESGDGHVPDFGWEVSTGSSSTLLRGDGGEGVQSHSFVDGKTCTLFLENGGYRIYHPTAPFKRRGQAEIHEKDDKESTYRYWRCKADEQVPMQQAAWRRAEIVIAPANMATLTASLESPHVTRVDGRLWDELYGTGTPLNLKEFPELDKLLRYHRDAIVCSMAHGDDWGNVTSYSDAKTTGAIYGMNRLNHCPAIFEEGYRSGDRRLLETAVLWCDNFFDQSIWWGEGATGGTRYNNVSASTGIPPDREYMWRSNNSVHFCTKGYDNFFMAYEQTGDQRMLEALRTQMDYAAEHIHSDRGEARNIGDVADFVKLYRFTNEQRYLNEALRLFRELRTKLSEGDLFSQSGRQIVPHPPFINDDKTGYKYPFAKPYIIGYALAGLPELMRYAPQEPKLRDVVQAVADFLVESQDAVGGWRYPHPRSSSVSMSQAMEHARQLVQADKALGAQRTHLDAIERVLRQRVQGWLKTGQIFGGLTGWEIATNRVENQQELYKLYQTPESRDQTRDYTEGQPGFGGSPPEGLVYFPEVLAFYLEHRPASRLLAAPTDDEPLGKVLARVSGKKEDK